MSDANVLGALDKQSGGYKRPSLNNILIYGRVRCIINRPALVGDSIIDGDGFYAILDAYAFKCLGEDYFRDSYSYDVNSIYFTKGSILIYISDPTLVGKDVKVYGKSKSFGATIRRQASSNPEEGISAFMFGAPQKSWRGRTVYQIVPNTVIRLNVKDPDARGTDLEDFIVSVFAMQGGEIPYPKTLDSIIPYTGANIYTEISVDDIKRASKGKTKEKERKSSPYIFSTGDVDVSKIDMKLTFHLQGQERSQFYEPFKEDIQLNAKARKDFAKEAIFELSERMSSYEGSDFYWLKDSFIKNIVDHPEKRLGITRTLCKQYILDFVDNCYTGVSLSEEKQGTRYSDGQLRMIKDGIDKLKKGILSDASLLYGDSGEDGIDDIPMLSDDFAFVLNVISVCSGIPFSTISGNYLYSGRMAGINRNLYLYSLLRCPYILGMIGVGLSVSDCDVLYYSFGKVFGASEDEDLNTKYRSYMIMLDTLSNCMVGVYKKYNRAGQVNTFVKRKDYARADKCYSNKALGFLSRYDFVSKPENKALLEMLLGNKVEIKGTDLNYILDNKWYSNDLFDELVSAGIVNTLDDYCALERVIEQEFLIYETFERMGKLPTGIVDYTINEVIDDFEKDRGFKLESLQREGIKLCKYRAGVLSGCAGSGKTTTSDCMTEVLKTLGDKKIIYCAPTGKASRRLAEVVHGTVKTIHSQFNVNIGGSSYLQGAYKRKEDTPGDGSIYILDEMAMCSTDLMYNIAKNITEKDIIYFLGDVKQLPPIGGGRPFKTLMTILPCVELGVSKRAAEGSLVNYNTSLINFMSDDVVADLKYDGKTFIDKSCHDVDIANTVKSVFISFMDGTLNGIKYDEDDIQVITGYQKKEKFSSTYRLNAPIQEFLRKNDKVLYYRETREQGERNIPYYKNERVIYVNKNSYDICRYVLDDKGVFHQVPTFGCVNGEMGKLVGIVNSEHANIEEFVKENTVAGEGFYSNVSDEDLEAIVDRFESRQDSMRVDSSLSHKDHYFLLMQVYDSDLRRDVICLLRGRAHVAITGEVCLSGTDLDNLALAYALTCHKMQGSQSKVVIAVFESTGNPDFINRNMINTIITRSQGVVCCVGSVSGQDSMLNRGRRKVSKTDSRDVLSVLSGTDDWL